MNDWFLVGSSNNPNWLTEYKVDGGLLVKGAVRAAPTNTDSDRHTLHPNGSLVIATAVGGPHPRAYAADIDPPSGEVISAGQMAIDSNLSFGNCFPSGFSESSGLFMLIRGRQFSANSFSIQLGSGTFSEGFSSEGTHSIPGVSGGFRSGDISPSGNRAAFVQSGTSTSRMLFYYDIQDGIFTQLDSKQLAQFEDGQVQWVNESRFVVISSIATRLYDVSNGSIQEVGSTTYAQKSNQQNFRVTKWNNRFCVGTINDEAFVLGVSGDDIEIITTISDPATRGISFSFSGSYLVTCGGDTVRLWGWNNGDPTLLDTDDISGATLWSVMAPRPLTDPPPTPEQTFRATFPDASGRKQSYPKILRTGSKQNELFQLNNALRKLYGELIELDTRYATLLSTYQALKSPR